MGAVGIWSMHFIGNRAITMEEGQPEFQIGYSPAYTAGSFFLPILAVAGAFYIVDISQEMTIGWTTAGGMLCGLAICGMHYMGQGGISNYKAIYNWKYVVGSAIIAVVAATLALGIFFWMKSKWTNRWWKRMTSALLLAASVSGMHWVATVGTSYRLKSSVNVMAAGMSRETTIVVVICLVRSQSSSMV
jgi:NO-binding membrane sensor protein with MHYT domain